MYKENFLTLVKAIQQKEGLKLIVDVDSFETFEKQFKKLFLLTDAFVVRDVTKRSLNEISSVSIPVSEQYKYPADIDYENFPPFIIPPPLGVQSYWTASKTMLKNGTTVPVAFKYHSFFPKGFYEWTFGEGQKYLKTGQVIYAPFIPSLQMECELMRMYKYSISDSFNAQAGYFVNYDWLNDADLNTLSYLKLPTIENIDIETLNKIKEDNYDSYRAFSNELLNSVKNIKSAFLSDKWAEEIRYINKYQIEENINRINIELSKLKRMRTLRSKGMAIGLLIVDIVSKTLNIPVLSAVSKILPGMSEINDTNRKIEKLKESPSYFLWRIKTMEDNK